MNKIDVKIAAQLLKENDNILILTHRNPDGDTLGSGFALLNALKKLGKRAKVICTDNIPEKYSYMTDGNDEEIFENPYVTAVDVADITLIGNALLERYGDKVELCIDHHVSNKGFAKNLLLRECSAACEIVYDVILEMGVDIDKKIANCLYTGISTDTGCFLFSNVTEKTHLIAADLIKRGADFVDINKIMFETKTMNYFKLEAAALSTIETYFDGKCAFMTITQEMQQQAGTKESDCDGIAGLPRKIDGVLVSATLRERPDGTLKVSMRSHAPIDSSKICLALGGGGHARAAGCEFNREHPEKDKQKLLSIIEMELKNI